MSHKLSQALFLPLLLAGGAADVAASAPAQAIAGVGAFSAEPIAPRSLGAERESDRPETIGPYRLIRKLGSGGMGTVYLAESIEIAERIVALKVIRDDVLSPELLAQFEVERGALAAASHDHVARLFDSGTTTDGRPWLALEHVAGEPITAYCDRRRLGVEKRLRLFVDVCAAVQHLHERGILHGDLKPGNILVSERDGKPVPKIIDLGLARLHGRGHDDPESPDSMGGTFAYMAPEQLALRPAVIDERRDVYSLGIILHELVAGTRPASASGRAFFGVPIATFDGECLTPSAQLRELGAGAAPIARLRGSSVLRLRFRLLGALDGIVRRAIEPRRERRCASAAELASAVERDLRSHASARRFVATATLVAAAAAASFAGGFLAASAG